MNVFEVWRSHCDKSIKFDPKPSWEARQAVLNHDLIDKYLQGGSILTLFFDGKLGLKRIIDTSGAVYREGAKNLVAAILQLK